MLESVIRTFKVPFNKHSSVAAMLVTSHDVNFMMGFVKDDDNFAMPSTDNVSEINSFVFKIVAAYSSRQSINLAKCQNI